jgi:hypothetical protein
MTAHLRRLAWPVALVATIALAGCSATQQGTTVDDDGGADDPGEVVTGAGGELCSILTEQDITTIAGAEVTSSELAEGDCNFTIDETSLINVRYESAFDPNLETARSICDDAEEISGVGDQAIWCPGVSVLYFNKGDRSVAVQLVFLTDAPREAKDVASEIARRISDGL